MNSLRTHCHTRSPASSAARHVPDPSHAVVDAARELVGSLRWRGGTALDAAAGWQVSTNTRWGHRNDFARWLRGHGPEPDEHSTMNCVEAVLLAAYRARVVGRRWLKVIHDHAAEAAAEAYERQEYAAIGHEPVDPVAAYTETLTRRLYTGPLTPYPMERARAARPEIPAGHLVFFGNTIDHLALSAGGRDVCGRQRVLSLWAVPARVPPGPIDHAVTYGVMQETTVEELADALPLDTEVTHATPVWRAERCDLAGERCAA